MKNNFAYGSISLKLSYEGWICLRYGASITAVAKMCQNRNMHTLFCLNNAISTACTYSCICCETEITLFGGPRPGDTGTNDAW